MGNTCGLKIKKIGEKNILKEIIFLENKTIVEYVYFITKLNRYYIENFRKNSYIKELTIVNIFSHKEFNIRIENIHPELFFNGIDYEIADLPDMHHVLFISNVCPDSLSFKIGIEANAMILLGNAKKYFTAIKDVEDEVCSNNARFVFYNFVKDTITFVDFEVYRNFETGMLTMGFECHEMQNEFFIKNFLVKPFQNKMYLPHAKKENDKNISINPGVFLEEYQEKGVGNAETEGDREKEKEKEKEENINNLSTEKALPISLNECELSIPQENATEADLERLFDINEKVKGKDTDVKPYNENHSTPTIEVVETTHNNLIKTHIITDQVNVSPQNRQIKEDGSTSNKRSNKEGKMNSKYTFSKVKSKYDKKLSIFEKIDSNYNFMNISKRSPESQTQIAPSSRKACTAMNNIEVKQKNVILIKGVYLTKSEHKDTNCLKISKLEEYTFNMK